MTPPSTRAPAHNAFPRLITERSSATPHDTIGFLQVDAHKRIEVGNAANGEFRLIQCLFSPHNFLYAKYQPVIQTYERVFSAVRAGIDTSRVRRSSGESAEQEMTSRVERLLANVRRSEIGKYFSFIAQEGTVHMARA